MTLHQRCYHKIRISVFSPFRGVNFMSFTQIAVNIVLRSHNGSAQLVKPASTSRNPAQILAFYKFSQLCTGKQHHRNYRTDHTKVTAHTTFSLQQSTTSHSIVSEN
ncbi:hypothetical protein EUGRSUZ_K03056 [Eucalyptus grandis]|uniref:Uncharacterized protein n=2 Tax=Eucalyptus grandis TaxID=71139 RepID=A0ACC3J143_EUCGR|nr:hypothetical protein EUGRSUZ_K03056 [Eucalyptus grandis]